MFEYNNQPLSMEDLQQGAVDAGMNFDEYFNRLTALGMVEKKEGVEDGTIDPATGEKWTKEAAIANMKAKGKSGKGVGGIEVHIPTPAEIAVKDVHDIRKNINENTPAVVGAIAEEYFNLDNFERFRRDDKTSPGNFTPSRYRGTVFHPLAGLQEDYQGESRYKNTEDEDLKRYFEKEITDRWGFGRKTGDFTKYEQY